MYKVYNAINKVTGISYFSEIKSKTGLGKDELNFNIMILEKMGLISIQEDPEKIHNPKIIRVDIYKDVKKTESD